MKAVARNLFRLSQNFSGKRISCRTSTSVSRILNQKSISFGLQKYFRTSVNQRGIRVVQAVPYDAYGVRIEFSDGTKRDFRYIWLRDCCQCTECFDEERGHRLFNTNELDIDVKPIAMWITDSGDLGIKWMQGNDDHCSVFESLWLKEQEVSFEEGTYGVEHATRYRPSLILWDRKLLEQRNLPQITYGTFGFSEEGVKTWLHLFYEYGFVILRDVPLSKEALTDVANRLSYVRPTSVGSVVNEQFSSHLQPSHLGSKAQPLHNDLVYRERSPGVILFQFLEAGKSETAPEYTGGQTILSDGFFTANWIRQKYEPFFEILTSVPVCYGHRDPGSGVCYSSYWPVIGLNPLGAVEEIHHCPLTRKPLKMHSDEMLTFYEALLQFGKKLDASHVLLNMRQGDLLGVNNRRILHGQTGFNALNVNRHTRICYLDLDEVLYKFDALLEQNGKPKELVDVQ